MSSKTIIIFFAFATVFIYSLFINHLFAIEAQVSEGIGRPYIEYQAESLRDPFQGYYKEGKEQEPVEPEEEGQVIKPLPTLTVQGIIWGSSIPQAIINNKVVKVGDTIEEVRVIKIDKEGLTLLYEGRQYNLSSPGIASLQNLQKKTPKEEKNE